MRLLLRAFASKCFFVFFVFFMPGLGVSCARSAGSAHSNDRPGAIQFGCSS